MLAILDDHSARRTATDEEHEYFPSFNNSIWPDQRSATDDVTFIITIDNDRSCSQHARQRCVFLKINDRVYVSFSKKDKIRCDAAVLL